MILLILAASLSSYEYDPATFDNSELSLIIGKPFQPNPNIDEVDFVMNTCKNPPTESDNFEMHTCSLKKEIGKASHGAVVGKYSTTFGTKSWTSIGYLMKNETSGSYQLAHYSPSERKVLASDICDSSDCDYHFYELHLLK
ncbi:hypothetical protein BLNAU_3080 [Blattamonas nauphoetae]|uniref:Uncharacterized protein n=1 Tax=Blattamonas nauphoetae TaxID=2049346 RepID=A0ABQ9YE26_9EUKA|nr:hypothetical protein BLNAU_3080 [Blattamonas nauphoetae]